MIGPEVACIPYKVSVGITYVTILVIMLVAMALLAGF